MTASKNSKTGLKLYSRTSLVTERGDWQAQLVLLHDTDSDCSLINWHLLLRKGPSYLHNQQCCLFANSSRHHTNPVDELNLEKESRSFEQQSHCWFASATAEQHPGAARGYGWHWVWWGQVLCGWCTCSQQGHWCSSCCTGRQPCCRSGSFSRSLESAKLLQVGLGSLAAVFQSSGQEEENAELQCAWDSDWHADSLAAVSHSLSQFESPVAAEWLMSLNIQKVDECLLRDIWAGHGAT